MINFSLFKTSLKTGAMAVIAIVAAFFTGRFIGWGEGKAKARKIQDNRKAEIEKQTQKNTQLFNRLNRNRRLKWLRRPRDRE